MVLDGTVVASDLAFGVGLKSKRVEAYSSAPHS